MTVVEMERSRQRFLRCLVIHVRFERWSASFSLRFLCFMDNSGILSVVIEGIRIRHKFLHFGLKADFLAFESDLIQISFDLESLSSFIIKFLPFTTNLLHNLESWHFRTCFLNPFPCFSHEDHVCRQTLFRCCSFNLLESGFASPFCIERLHFIGKSLFV